MGVGGVDGSGKSWFARRLVELLAQQHTVAALMHVDDFRRPVDWRRGHFPESELYYRHYYDLELLDECARHFLAGASAAVVPRFDSARERLHGLESIAFGQATLLVVEGVFLRRVPSVAAGIGVWLRTSVPEAARRVVERDTRRGRSLAEVTRRLEQRYLPCHDRYLSEHSPEARAQVVVDNESFDASCVERVDASLAGSALARALQSFNKSCRFRHPSSSMRPASTPPVQFSASQG